MSAFTDSPSMLAMAIVMLAVEALSLLMMIIVILAFRRVQRKQERLLLSFGASIGSIRHPLLIACYITVTMIITLVSMYLFLAQPHLL